MNLSTYHFEAKPASTEGQGDEDRLREEVDRLWAMLDLEPVDAEPLIREVTA